MLVGWSIRPSVGMSICMWARVKKWETSVFRTFLSRCLCWKGGWMGRWVWMGVGRLYPPVRYDIVTPRHFFSVILCNSFSLLNYFLCVILLYISVAFHVVKLKKRKHIKGEIFDDTKLADILISKQYSPCPATIQPRTPAYCLRLPAPLHCTCSPASD